VGPDELKRRLRERLDALGAAPRTELLHVLMLPDFERADRIGEFWGTARTRAFAELLIDCEEEPDPSGGARRHVAGDGTEVAPNNAARRPTRDPRNSGKRPWLLVPFMRHDANEGVAHPLGAYAGRLPPNLGADGTESPSWRTLSAFSSERR
jgi:hypothetical protein